jgi:hypothetical protein
MKAWNELKRRIAEKLVGVDEVRRMLAEENTEAAERNIEEVWVGQGGRATKIKDMTAGHCKNSLGLIMRNLRNSRVCYLSRSGRITFAPMLHTLVDHKISWLDDEGRINMTADERSV